MKFKRASKIVTAAIRADPCLHEAFQANIAMAFIDNARWYREQLGGIRVLSLADIHAIANQAANYFLEQWTSERRRTER